MSYNIMVKKTDGATPMYMFLTSNIDGRTTPKEFTSLETLDLYIEKLLNNGRYKKTDLLPVQVVNYKVSTDIHVQDNSSTDENGTVEDPEDLETE